jgi:hypothetical protein
LAAAKQSGWQRECLRAPCDPDTARMAQNATPIGFAGDCNAATRSYDKYHNSNAEAAAFRRRFPWNTTAIAAPGRRPS